MNKQFATILHYGLLIAAALVSIKTVEYAFGEAFSGGSIPFWLPIAMFFSVIVLVSGAIYVKVKYIRQ